MDVGLKLAENWYRKVFPNSEMKYHNLEHVKATTAVAMKIFVGLLDSMREKHNGEGLFSDEDGMKKIVVLAANIFALHEVDDWWGNLENVPGAEIMKAELEKSLMKQGIVIGDFNKLIILDDFSKDLPEMLKQIKEAGLTGFLEMVPENQRMEIAEAIGIALNAADFAQVCNASYSEKVKIEDRKGNSLSTFKGVLVLAREFEIFRKNGLKGAGWEDKLSPGKADLAKVLWGRWFFNNKAFPRIMRGMLALYGFDKVEARNLWKRLGELQEEFVD